MVAVNCLCGVRSNRHFAYLITNVTHAICKSLLFQSVSDGLFIALRLNGHLRRAVPNTK